MHPMREGLRNPYFKVVCLMQCIAHACVAAGAHLPSLKVFACLTLPAWQTCKACSIRPPSMHTWHRSKSLPFCEKTGPVH
jgi:hypothetical protein